MSQPTRRAPLKAGRRRAITVTVDEVTHAGLTRIGNGNRSAAIEQLVREHLAKRRRTRSAESATTA